MLLTELSSYPLIAQNRSLSINLAETATLTLNAEYSAAVSKNLTIHIPFHWKPFNTHETERDKKLTINPGIRFWKWHNYSGLFLSSSAFCSIYNKTKGRFRYEGLAAGISLSSGYAMMLSRNWNIELQAGLSLIRTRYEQYHKRICGEYYSTSSATLLRVYPVSIAVAYIF